MWSRAVVAGLQLALSRVGHSRAGAQVMARSCRPAEIGVAGRCRRRRRRRSRPPAALACAGGASTRSPGASSSRRSSTARAWSTTRRASLPVSMNGSRSSRGQELAQPGRWMQGRPAPPPTCRRPPTCLPPFCLLADITPYCKSADGTYHFTVETKCAGGVEGAMGGRGRRLPLLAAAGRWQQLAVLRAHGRAGARLARRGGRPGSAAAAAGSWALVSVGQAGPQGRSRPGSARTAGADASYCALLTPKIAPCLHTPPGTRATRTSSTSAPLTWRPTSRAATRRGCRPAPSSPRCAPGLGALRAGRWALCAGRGACRLPPRAHAGLLDRAAAAVPGGPARPARTPSHTCLLATCK